MLKCEQVTNKYQKITLCNVICSWCASASGIPSLGAVFVSACYDISYIYIFNINLLSNCFGSYEVVLNLDKVKHKFDGPIYYYVFNTLLFSLLVLHIYWWVLMCRMLVRQIQSRGQIGDDVRSGMFVSLKKIFPLLCILDESITSH